MTGQQEKISELKIKIKQESNKLINALSQVEIHKVALLKAIQQIDELKLLK